MKKLFVALMVVAIAGLLASSAVANDVAQKVGIGVGLGLEKYDGEGSLTDNSDFKSAKEMFIRYGLSSKVGIIFNYSLVELETDSFKTDIKPALDMRLLFTMFPEYRISPFVFTGAGLIDFTPTAVDPAFDIRIEEHEDFGKRKAMFLLGAGVEFFINEYVALHALVDAYMPFTDQLDARVMGDRDDMYWGGKVGLTLFGGTTDSDGDGIPNKRDADPKHPEDFDDFEDDDGAPDFDNDHDGIPDMYDWAPLTKEDVDNFEDWDGAPDYDNDGDGIPDDKDKAPNHPEDFDSFEDEDGAPDFDNDNDGIPDIYDGAPNEPETFNGKEDWDGVPDEVERVERAPEPVPVKVDIMPEKVGEKIVLRGVNFETASAKLTLNSHAVLDNVVEVLNEYPEIEIEIQGHTDSQGSDSYNLDLSQRRANSVRAYLLQKGIAASRISAVGYGESIPRATNDTAEGRAQNRRVEFLRLK
jgi:outer membrane protein OmpA-like peptidoglycan-associated protein